MKWSNNCLLRVAALYLIALAGLALSISFELPTNFRKCLREEVQKNVLVTGEFEVQPELPGVKTDLHVSVLGRISDDVAKLGNAILTHTNTGRRRERPTSLRQGRCAQGQVCLHHGRVRDVRRLLRNASSRW